ncbi:MAG: hypothetical protein KBG15_16885 [Kofleriaceae bacterium]|nr:hypothetical protein [Kofleriaceae bacterium]
MKPASDAGAAAGTATAAAFICTLTCKMQPTAPALPGFTYRVDHQARGSTYGIRIFPSLGVEIILK